MSVIDIFDNSSMSGVEDARGGAGDE